MVTYTAVVSSETRVRSTTVKTGTREWNKSISELELLVLPTKTTKR